MRRIVAVGMIGLACAGMSGSIIKAPLEKQCSSSGLKACPDLSEGVALYVDGRKAEGTERLRVVAASNSPEQVQTAAKAIIALSEIPGAANYARPFADIAKQLISMNTEVRVAAATAVPNSPATVETTKPPDLSNPYPTVPDGKELALRLAADRAIAAPVDPTRLETRSTALTLGGARCAVHGADALCVRLLDGPFVLTDFVAHGGCPDLLFLGSSPLNEAVDTQLRVQPTWLVPRA